MFVVDTNIIAPLYIRGAYTEAVHELRRRDGFWRTDPFAMIEFSNVLATYRRARYLTTAEAEQCLLEADRFLRPHYIEVPYMRPWNSRSGTTSQPMTRVSSRWRLSSAHGLSRKTASCARPHPRSRNRWQKLWRRSKPRKSCSKRAVNPKKFLVELKRRNVYRAAVLSQVERMRPFVKAGGRWS